MYLDALAIGHENARIILHLTTLRKVDDRFNTSSNNGQIDHTHIVCLIRQKPPNLQGETLESLERHDELCPDLNNIAVSHPAVDTTTEDDVDSRPQVTVSMLDNSERQVGGVGSW